MPTEITYDSFYYGDESNQFSFYRIPHELITGERFTKLLTDAKLLYGLQHCKRRAVPYAIRRELLQLDRYQEQFLYLQKNHIETAEQLSMQYDALRAEIDALVERRATLYRWRRAGGEV